MGFVRRASLFAVLVWICLPGSALMAEPAAKKPPKLELKPCSQYNNDNSVDDIEEVRAALVDRVAAGRRVRPARLP